MSGEARSASSNRESTPEADDEMRQVAKLEQEAAYLAPTMVREGPVFSTPDSMTFLGQKIYGGDYVRATYSKMFENRQLPTKMWLDGVSDIKVVYPNPRLQCVSPAWAGGPDRCAR